MNSQLKNRTLTSHIFSNSGTIAIVIVFGYLFFQEAMSHLEHLDKVVGYAIIFAFAIIFGGASMFINYILSRKA